MAEGISPATSESNQAQTPRVTRRRWQIALGGTVVVAAAAAGMMQVWQGENAQSAEATGAVGKASVAASDAGTVGKPRFLAKVGNASVSYDQVADEAMARHGQEVLDQLINRTIIELACRNRNVAITESEVEQEIASIAQEFGLDRTAWLQMLQAERNISPAQYRRDVIWPMLALKKLAGTEVQITEADVQKAFERDFGPRVKARMIMMDNLRRIQEVWEKANQAKAAAEADASSPTEALAKAGNEFGRLAREYSMEPTSKSLDGTFPPIRHHSGQGSLEQAAFSLKPGEISGIVHLAIPGSPRYVILFCEGQTEPVVKADQMDLVREDITAQLKKEKVQESVATLFTKLRAETQVHNYLTGTSSGGENQVISATGSQAAGSPIHGIQPVGATSSAANALTR